MGVAARSQLCECSDGSRAFEDGAVHEKREPEGPSSYRRACVVLGFARGYPVSEVRESKVTLFRQVNCCDH